MRRLKQQLLAACSMSTSFLCVPGPVVGPLGASSGLSQAKLRPIRHQFSRFGSLAWSRGRSHHGDLLHLLLFSSAQCGITQGVRSGQRSQDAQ